MKPFKLFSMIVIIIMICACSENEDTTNLLIPSPDNSLQNDTIGNVTGNDSGNVSNDNSIMDMDFGFLDIFDSNSSYLEMPIESSPTNLIVGRWTITKKSVVDENKVDYDYQDFKNKDCGKSFLQFNNDGIVFENNFKYDNKVETCILYVAKSQYEFITETRMKTSNFDQIYIIKLTQDELIILYDYNNTAWGPLQLYFHYKRIYE